MRLLIIAPILLASAIAQSTPDILGCASAAITSIAKSNPTPCTSNNSQECLCANKAAFQSLQTDSVPACFGLDFSSLVSALCSDEIKSLENISTEIKAAATKSTESKSTETKPAFRHAGRPMQPVKRGDGAKLTIYVTETGSDCGCTSTTSAGGVHGTPVAGSMHISQIPVNVPTSSIGSLVAAASSTPVGKEHGVMGGAASSSASSAVFGSMVGATPSAGASGADPKSFSPYMGAAVGVSVNGIVVFGVAAVMAVIVAL